MRRVLPLLLLLLPGLVQAQPGLSVVTSAPLAGGGEEYTVSLQVLILMTLLTLLPAAFIMMTSFTRIIIVLALLRQSLGTAQTPSNQILIGLAFFLTLFIMSPVFTQAYEEGVKPYMDEQITSTEALQRAAVPFRRFMLAQTRENDLELFARLAGIKQLNAPEDTPFTVLMPAFITSELKTAFQIGFLIMIPFLIIDLVVSSVLMSMGMVMLSPLIISLPFKIMLFVLVDGWGLLIGTLAQSFVT
ncbi:MAG: flagellar biosynthetic protein FliP [Gammaproteobacteria bacterium]|nr:MAG: flagellar biosynthetic protein FliP [Gammaproteobacteria bacterium]